VAVEGILRLIVILMVVMIATMMEVGTAAVMVVMGVAIPMLAGTVETAALDTSNVSKDMFI